MKRFDGRVVLVTGGSRNTGLEIVDLFLREGACVFFCGSNVSSVEDGARELARRGLSGFTALKCDVGNTADVTAMMDVIAREAGRLDVVVSNAAHLGSGEGSAVDADEGMFFLKQVPNPATGQKGVVVCIGSNTAQHVQRKHVSYCTSKGGLESMVKCFAVDLGPLGVRVNLLEPGYIHTERWRDLPENVKAKRRANTLTGRESTGKNVADAVAFLSSDEASTFQGAVIKMDSGATVSLSNPKRPF